MKIPFDIKFRPQIESGEYKVETHSGYPVTIYRWDFDDGAQTPIMGSYVFEDGKEYVGAWNEEGHFDLMSPNDLDLFIITPAEDGEESIRKAISVAICGTTAEAVLEANGVKLVDALSYLEKQKEQKPSPEDAVRFEGFCEGAKATKKDFWARGLEFDAYISPSGRQITCAYRKDMEEAMTKITSKLSNGDKLRLIYMKDGEVINE